MTEEVIHTNWRYIMGVQYDRDHYAYPYGTNHQDYHIQDIVLTNNGISGRNSSPDFPAPSPTDPPVLTDQSITGLVWASSIDYRNQRAPATQQGSDFEFKYVQPFGAESHPVALAYDIDDESDGGNPGPDWGDPAETEYYMNLLVGDAYMLYGPLFVSEGPGAAYDTDNPDEPTFRTVWYERGYDTGAKDYSPTTPAETREYLCDGSLSLSINQSFRDYPVTLPVAQSSQGPTAVLGYGPQDGDLNLANVANHGWDLAFNESVHIVNFMASGKLDQEEGRRIGAAWNTAKAASAAPETWMSAEDIALVQTGMDTVEKAAAMAWWNYYGEFPSNVTVDDLAAWGVAGMTAKPAAHGKYDVAEAPRPPGFLSVRPNDRENEGGIEVRWGTEAESAVDHDTGVADLARYRVYRQATSRAAPWVVVADGDWNNFAEAAEQAGTYGVTIPAGRFYVDYTVTPGEEYWYCVVAVDDGTQNWEIPGDVLESTRWWTWSGYSYAGCVAPEGGTDASLAQPGQFALSQNVPNPFNPTTSINFSVPTTGAAKLAVYNAAGQLVRTLVDGTVEAGAHQVTWNGMDDAGRAVASGVYLYRLSTPDNQMVRRMVLVR